MNTSTSTNTNEVLDIAYLMSPEAVRNRCGLILEAVDREETQHFRLVPERYGAVVDYVVDVTWRHYPTLEIPVHGRIRHFSAGGIERQHLVAPGADSTERAKALLDLTVVSVLLDAGAGPTWKYSESETGQSHSRSEGLAVASVRAMQGGLFSSVLGNPWRADADMLCRLTTADLAAAFQHSDDNPLVGLDGRAELMRQLGRTAAARPDVFGEPARLGNLCDFLGRQGKTIEAADILITLLKVLNPIWPSRIMAGNVSLGDCGHHSLIKGDGLVPFHKLSQWLSYSLFEPLELAGFTVANPNRLTGLGEYRNAGLFTDLGVLVPRDLRLLTIRHDPMSEVIVEWRALAVALLDRIYPRVRAELGLNQAEFPLVKMLQGGTWQAGRELANQLRPSGGAPPLLIESDGTLF